MSRNSKQAGKSGKGAAKRRERRNQVRHQIRKIIDCWTVRLVLQPLGKDGHGKAVLVAKLVGVPSRARDAVNCKFEELRTLVLNDLGVKLQPPSWIGYQPQG